MTPPDNGSNRTLAGIAAALGIAIGVAPTALLAQDTAHAKTEAKVNKTSTNMKVDVSATQNKLAPFTYNKAQAGGSQVGGGSGAGKAAMLDKASPKLGVVNPSVAGSQKKTAMQYKAPSTAATQMKSTLPAVQDKAATQMKESSAATAPQ